MLLDTFVRQKKLTLDNNSNNIILEVLSVQKNKVLSSRVIFTYNILSRTVENLRLCSSY